MDDETMDDEAVYDEAEEAMWKDTRLQGGGRELSRLGGGVLYEVASLREKAKDEEERQQVWGGILHLLVRWMGAHRVL